MQFMLNLMTSKFRATVYDEPVNHLISLQFLQSKGMNFTNSTAIFNLSHKGSLFPPFLAMRLVNYCHVHIQLL